MLQDVIAKRYPTEIMYLNGRVSRIGREGHGLDVQTNDSVTKTVENRPITKIAIHPSNVNSLMITASSF